jgi:DNA polymerase-3 subunit delta
VSQLRADGLAAALIRRLPPIVWVHGDEALLALEAADATRNAARAAGFTGRQVFDGGRGFRPAMLLAEAASLSLFGDAKLLELRLAAKPGKELGQALATLAPQLSDEVRLLIMSPRLDRATTESAWFAQVDRRGYIVPVFPVARQQLPQWIGARLARQGQRADPGTLEFIAERVEGNLLAAHQEVSKLALLFPEGDLPADETRAAVLNVARYGAFDLVDPMLAGDAARTLRTLQGLRAEGEAGPLILWAVADALRTLLRLHEARTAGRPLAAEMRAARVYAPRDRLYERALGRLDENAVHRALQQAALTDRMMKGLVPGDAWRVLDTLTMTIAGVAMPAGN